MTMTDHYSILGVPRTADESAIKSAYRKLARKYHPDVNPGDMVAEARFKAIGEAYGILGDAEKKKDYDSFDDSPPPRTERTDRPYRHRGHIEIMREFFDRLESRRNWRSRLDPRNWFTGSSDVPKHSRDYFDDRIGHDSVAESLANLVNDTNCYFQEEFDARDRPEPYLEKRLEERKQDILDQHTIEIRKNVDLSTMGVASMLYNNATLVAGEQPDLSSVTKLQAMKYSILDGFVSEVRRYAVTYKEAAPVHYEMALSFAEHDQDPGVLSRLHIMSDLIRNM